MADDAGKIEALYDTDVVAWAEQQAAALRARHAGRSMLDYENLAEVIEDLAKRETKGCRSQIDIILEHLLKLEFATPSLLRDNERGWRVSVRKARAELADDLTPTLRRRLPSELPARCAKQAKWLLEDELIATQAAAAVDARGGYSWAEVIGEDWWPQRT